MQSDSTVIFILGGVYAIAVWLVLHHVIGIKLRLYSRIKCRLGFHKRTEKRIDMIIRHYKCLNCNKPKDHPHLQSLDGGKKDLGIKFNW